MRETSWGIEEEINLLQPLNTNTLDNDTFAFSKGGPAIKNNGLNRDGGITELYENTTAWPDVDYAYITTNGLVLGIKDDGTVLSTRSAAATTAPLFPGSTLYPSTSLYPGGGFGDVVEIGKLNAFNFFKRAAVPTYYLDCVVSSSTSVSGYTYTLIAARFGSETTIIIEELDPQTMQVLDIAGSPQRYTASISSVTLIPSVCFARMNVMTFGNAATTTWGTVITDGGFIYNVGTAVHYWRNATTRDTTKTTDLNYQAFTCYYNAGTVIFTTSYNGTSGAYFNSTVAGGLVANPGVFTTWSASRTYSSVDALMLGDSGANILSDVATTLKLGASTASATYPCFFVNIDAAGAVTTTTGFGSGTAYLYYGVDSAGAAINPESDFRMDYGIVTPYGACGICHDHNGGTPNGYGNFHLGTASVWVTSTVAPVNLGRLAYPQLDVAHQMLRVRSSKGFIALITGNTYGIAGSGAFADTLDAGNLINDYAGGTFEYDIASGNPAAPGYDNIVGARNFYFYPMSWRGATATTGITVYRLNNGDFVAVNSSTTPQFNELAPGIVSLNTLSAWGGIIDVNAQTMHYNYSGYTPSFKFGRDNGATDPSLLYIRIFNRYSSSLEQGQIGALYSQCMPMSGTTMQGWTVWDGESGNNLGDFTTSNFSTTTATNTTAPYAPHAGIWVANNNAPPGADSIFLGGGIQMLNSVAIQTPNYYGYYLLPEGGGSNLLPWRTANVFLLQGTYYGYNNEYVYQINLTNGSSGVVQGAPIAIAYAVGLFYLCVSPKRAYFMSSFDNSVYYFDGGRSLVKFFEANTKSMIHAGEYNVRDNALYLATDTSVITIRDEQNSDETNTEGLQITENSYPTGWTDTDQAKSTAAGLYFLVGTTLVVRSYYNYGTIIPMDFQTAYYSPGEWQTMQMGRVVGQVCCTQDLDTTFTLTCYYIRVDGTTGSVSASVSAATRNANGYFRFSWTPSVSNVLASSVRIQHDATEQKVVLMELVMYYVPGPEVIPLTEVAVEI